MATAIDDNRLFANKKVHNINSTFQNERILRLCLCDILQIAMSLGAACTVYYT